MGLDPLEETYTDCYVVIGDEDVEPLTGAYHHFRGNLPNDGNKIYVCFTHSPGKEPINGFEVREGDMSELQLPPDVEVVDGNLGILGNPKYVVACSLMAQKKNRKQRRARIVTALWMFLFVL